MIVMGLGQVMTENVEDDPRMLKRSRKYESDSYSVLSNETSIVPSQIPISYENRLYQTQPRNQVIPQINMSGNICHTKETSDSHLDHGLSMDSTAGKEKNGGTSVCYTVSGVDQTAASQIAGILGIRRMALQDKYVGVPILIQKNKMETFGHLEERFKDQLATWKGISRGSVQTSSSARC
ncbi:uncharacterized protein LOC113283881 isoform X2 [Papaver somniferum]|uniref:uncharacterized protein LOC113283881 isoform X2 n=1 Tax=Papaver somniferum TaxID=3469 RepID=UPI000E6FA6B2|nr:uncharacterized protein LOC113283881 isoform X2 [Papaver somniferum]